MKVGPWQTVDGYCAARIIQGGDPYRVEDRVAFIEKTPRVRIRAAYHREQHGTYEDGGAYVDYRWEEFLDWCSGTKGNGADDPESREWCDNMLKLLGYELCD